VQIECIQLVEFRNYHTLSLSPAPRLNVLSGRNGQGKTNLLEAIAVLLTGRSFRTSRLVELAAWDTASASLSGDVRRDDGSRTLRRTIHRAEDGAWRSTGDLVPWAKVIVFGWQDLEIMHGPPGARRSFLDGFAGRLYASHIPTLLRYRQIVARRNSVLQSRMEGGLEARLAPWDEQLATVGVELIDRRRRAAAALQTELARVHPVVSGGASGALSRSEQKVEIRYRATVGEVSDVAGFIRAIEPRRREERRRGLTLVGPHRDDVAIELDGVDVRAFGSRGQQRLLALALRLAEVMPVRDAVGTAPVLLLDDALSELDERARQNVLREIQHTDQIFLTTPEPLAVSGAARWIVMGGGVAAA
jgi:DNA replication and repair protein RecF